MTSSVKEPQRAKEAARMASVYCTSAVTSSVFASQETLKNVKLLQQMYFNQPLSKKQNSENKSREAQVSSFHTVKFYFHIKQQNV